MAYDMDCFIAYMDSYKLSPFNKILDIAGETTIKVLEFQTFQLPMIGGLFPMKKPLTRKYKSVWISVNRMTSLNAPKPVSWQGATQLMVKLHHRLEDASNKPFLD